MEFDFIEPEKWVNNGVLKCGVKIPFSEFYYISLSPFSDHPLHPLHHNSIQKDTTITIRNVSLFILLF